MTEKRIIILGLALGLLGWAGLELVVGQNPDRFSAFFTGTREAIVLKKQMAIATREAPASVLFVGDSTVDSAIEDPLFRELTGEESINLGLNGNLIAYADYRMLKAYLEKFPPPKTVVVWHAVDVWPRDLNLADFFFTLPDWNDRRCAFGNLVRNIGWRRPGVIHRPIQYASQFLVGSAYSLSPAYRYKVWMKKIGNRFLPGIDPVGIVESLPASVLSSDTNLERQLAGLPSLGVAVSKDNRYWFHRFADLARRHDIKVWAARAPIHEAFVKNKRTKEFLDKQNLLLTQFFNEVGVPQINTTNPVFRSDQSRGDKDHVNPAGRAALTSYYAQLLRPARTQYAYR